MSDRLAQLEKLLAADPNDPFLTYGIALEHAKAGRFEQTIDWLDRTIALDSHYHFAYFQKAKALDELGRTDDAKAELERGIALATAANDEQAMRALAELLASL
jgi:tetratricopeptide (TPR) repeat protein